MTALGGHLCAEWGAGFTVRGETDARAAVAGARFVFSAIRPGQEAARAVDEEVPLKHGVLGQETTGPGGFAMALRTIPAMLDYARLIEEVAPDALLVNFTNPVGIVMQALHDHSSVRAVGICDGPISMQRSVADVPGPAARTRARRLLRAEPLRVDPPRAGRRAGPPARAARPVRGAPGGRRAVAAVRTGPRARDRDAPDGVPLLLLLPGPGRRAHPRLGQLPRAATADVERRPVAGAAEHASTRATCPARAQRGSAR